MNNLNINAVTIASYNKYAQEYIDKDTNDNDRRAAYWPGVENFLNVLDPGTKIFEIGSAMGRHANIMEGMGFAVDRSDATRAFVEYLCAQGQNAQHYDVLVAAVPCKYDAIYAHAVLLHFSLVDFRKALSNIHASLNNQGIFCFSMKLGDFEGWREKGLSGKRYFKYWTVTDLKRELAQANYKILNIFTTPEADFVFITAQKN